MKKTFYLIVAMAFALSVTAQQKGGGISPKMLQEIVNAQPKGAASKALANAIATNNIDDLARTRQSLFAIDKHFSIETPKQSITNQKSSGRCWMFSGLNVLRADFAKRHKDTLQVTFSQDYLFFYDQLERQEGTSKWKFSQLVNLAINGMTSYTVAPLRIAMYLGIGVSFVAFIYLIYILITTLLYGDPVAGYPTIMVTILFLGGIQLLTIGVLGEYLGRIFNETKNRPGYFVRRYNDEKV